MDTLVKTICCLAHTTAIACIDFLVNLIGYTIIMNEDEMHETSETNGTNGKYKTNEINV